MRASAGLSNIVPTFDCVLCDWVGRKLTFQRFGTGDALVIDLDTGEPIIE